MTDYTELKRLLDLGSLPPCVADLIAENERLAKQWGDRPAYRTPEYESKRDAMWRRAHMVATSKGYDHINMAIAAAPIACTDCMGCGGEWQGEGVPNSVCETCNGSRGKALEAERDQLKAELAGLRTGYEAYESVNMGLKAEVERLRSVRETMLCAAHELGLPVDAGAQDVVDAIHSMQVRCAELSKSLKTLIHISNATNWEAHTCGEIDKARNLLAAMGKGELS